MEKLYEREFSFVLAALCVGAELDGDSCTALAFLMKFNNCAVHILI